ncbi:uncharacterized protein PV09_01653 [Verruconis gallopava]|uniref:UBX domain-containing protein 2 n=1 Tax=Verruconis gallopava TaxID=253628 RepID=A0A0D1Z414_9PEZI|nr:uncharacterized protein PV09_01653 [Verruconis gallopava]KIW07722.1 hypothetical protein PV09_01653 [Verruconis gallopava]
MFHEGDLQSGIGLAIQQSKSVACFVRDDSLESSQWENEWLQDDEVSRLLQSRSVILRLNAGSQEAGFLSAFCPVNDVPALALIQHGQLLDLLTRPITEDEFKSRIRKALGAGTETLKDVQVAPAQSETASSSHSDASTPAAAITSQPAISVPLTDASSHDNEGRKESKGKQKQEDPTPALPAATHIQSSAPRNDWLEQQRQRQLDARKERERIMAQIEADKAERRARREQERRTREQATAETETESASSSLASKTRRTSSRASSSNLQVRLLDGSTIRKQFPADASLASDVRPWIDSHLETKAPYTFKQILAPQPARPISVGEEHSSLRELDLLPSATLVLQPVQTYSDAYAPASAGILSLPYNAVTGAYGIISGTLSGAANWLRGGLFRPEDDERGRTLGQQPQQESSTPYTNHADERPAPRGTPRNNIRIRTLADQRDGTVDQQFYNGNSLDFEPNIDDSTSSK